MVRPADMLVVDITLVGLHFDGARHRLVRAPDTPNAFILVGLPPQHVAEEVPDNLNNVTAPMQAVTAGSSRLAFSVPADIKELELSLDGLLDWERLVPLRVPDGLQSPDTPGTTVFQGVPRSIIEFPTRLLISYDEPVDWLGGARPQQADGRTALWHARLHPALDGAGPGAPDGGVKLRAFAMVTNGGTLPPGAPYVAPVLEDLVTLTSRIPLAGVGGPLEVHSAPLHAEQFLLTAMGTSAHLHGAWEPLLKPALDRYKEAGRRAPNLVVYDHITGLGRDQYVRIVRHGRMSTGHEALHVQEYRRLFIARPDDGIVAYLQREDRIIIKQPEMTYGAATGFQHQGREMPFQVLRITDRVTPVIIPPDLPPVPPPPLKEDKPELKAFWVILKDTGKDHEFTLIGTDSEGRKVSFTMPLIFVPDGLPDEDQQLKDRYDPAKETKEKLDQRQRRELHGQVMAMAEPPTGAAGSTSHAVGFLTFKLSPEGAPVAGRPYVSAAEVRVPAVEQFTPNAGDLKVVFNDTYLRQKMEGHPAGGYLDLTDPLKLTFGAAQAGGLSSPNAAVKTITSHAGVIPDVFQPDPATGAITDAKDIETIRKAFGGAQLLGIDLGQYLKKLVKDQLGALQQLGDDEIAKILGDANRLLPAPVLRMRDLADGQGKELRYVWKPPLERPPGGLIDVSGASLVLDARTVRSRDAIDKSTVQGSLTHFALDFLGMARVEFKELRFKTGPGQKPDVAASGVELKFRGPLEFINTLRSALPAEAFGPGAYIDVQPTGIRAGYKLAVPAMPLGVFNLANLALSAELAIPFDGQPVSFRFSVSEQKHPFTLTVSLFGGGGYFSLLLDASGVKEAEGAIEFGGAAALDLGVASGGVSVMAGIRFMLAKGDIKLSGYLRCNGFLTVLGIVTVTVEFYLELTYEKKGKQSIVRGRGTLTVSVRIAFFSKSVSLELERTFAGAPVDPTFAQCFSKEQDWPEYCAAFAA
ncbi:hypothetical protein [Streptomyces sp. NRRL S-337]|uniref:hypothetical protein n=1 Tax=Streptomyces sp. NRRL S-337 TaxID=1463900 RepID=UPI0004C8976B|nr:hypothetical protein [Streptomyces sp. NRRL S-337]